MNPFPFSSFSFKRSYSQNFLRDKNFIRKIINSPIQNCKAALEIGPGSGNLTEFLLEKYDTLLAIEKDKELIPYLNQNFPSLELFEMDFLLFSSSSIKTKIEHLGNIHLFSNIPYKHTSAFLTLFCRHSHLFSEAILMVQQEVAEKLLSPLPDYFISAKVQSAATITKIADVPKEAFYPVPRVRSSVIRLEFIPWEEEEWLCYEKFLSYLYLHKRKQIGAKLKRISQRAPLDKILKTSNLNPENRAHQIPAVQLRNLYFSLKPWLNLSLL